MLEDLLLDKILRIYNKNNKISCKMITYKEK
jgi:hypothetical protein